MEIGKQTQLLLALFVEINRRRGLERWVGCNGKSCARVVRQDLGRLSSHPWSFNHILSLCLGGTQNENQGT